EGSLGDMQARLDAAAARSAGVIERRGAAGFVRECHGDLHLNNIVLWHGRPTLFDALEFDPALATIDTLYDLAFLLMDLDHAGCREAANIVFNRYLWRNDQDMDLEGLVALPLFLVQRCLIRALVTAQQAQQSKLASPISGSASEDDQAQRYLRQAFDALESSPARLIGVGGLSGTGKSTLAAALAPHFGCSPGALHLRSDLERKALFGVEETQRLPAASYTTAVGAEVYERLVRKSRLALAAGHTVIVDAVFADPTERARLATIAAEAGVTFTGVWLDAPRETLIGRVEARRGDASDADGQVVARQLDSGVGRLDWTRVDASGSPDETLALAKLRLEI
ncbi:MAG: AAA family ATPase, partial [Hyphomicrobiaceae bacterium]